MAPRHRFVDRDAFARFAGIGVGCQRFQATQVLNIEVGPDYTGDTLDSQPGSGDSVGLEADGLGGDTGGERRLG